MYPHRAVLLTILGFFVFVMTGCDTCGIEITRPLYDGATIPSNYSLKMDRKYIGIDYHKKYTQIPVMDQAGENPCKNYL